MGFFSFFTLTQEIAIDLGTANTIIIHDDKIVVDEPSVVALEKKTDMFVADLCQLIVIQILQILAF